MGDKDIGLFKMVSGEEIISEYKVGGEEMPDYYLIRAPRLLFLAQVSQTEVGIKMRPWIIGNSDGVFPVHSAHILTVSNEIPEAIKAGYMKETSPLDLSATNQAAAAKILGA